MDDPSLDSTAAELGLTVEELRAARSEIRQGLDQAVLGGLIRFEDALFELSQ